MFTRIRFPTSAEGHYADFWLRLRATDFPSASLELAALCRGFTLAVGLEPKPLDLTSSRPRHMEEHTDEAIYAALHRMMKEHAQRAVPAKEPDHG